MVSPVIDRRLGLAGNSGAKQPVTVVATSNVTQSGEQTISGVALLASNAAGVPDRVLCTAQTDPIDNGVWEVQTSAWVRPDDMNGTGDIVRGTQVRVARGTAAGSTWYMTSADPVVIGTSSQTWSQDPAATESNISYGAIVSIVDGVLTQHATLQAAVTTVGSSRCTVVVRDDVTMTANASFPSTCTVRIENRAQITTTGYTLTLGAKPDLHPGQCFAGSGTVVFTDGVAGPGFMPQWWGAKADGTTDDRSAIQSCINAAAASGTTVGGTVVYFPPSASYYRMTGAGLTVTTSGMTLMGAGVGSALYHTGTGNTLEIGDGTNFISNVHVVGMNFQTTVASAKQILVRKAPNTKIDRCIFSHAGTSGEGIRLTESWCTTISNCVMGSVQAYAIHASNSANGMMVSGNRLDGASTSATCGIYIDGEGNALVGNTVETWATCVNLRAYSGIVHGNYFETYVTGILGDSSLGTGYDIRGNYFAPSAATVVSIKLTAGNNIHIGPNKYSFTHTGGAPIELTASTRVFIEEGQDHVDSYTVKWPRDHVFTWLHHLEDNARGFTPGYLVAVTHTGTVAETTLKTYTGTKEHWGTGTRIDVRVAGRITGTGGQKDVRLKLAGTTIGTVTEAAGSTDDWIIEASIDVQSATVANAIVKAWQGAAVEVGDVVQGGGVTLALDTTAPTITVTGQLGNTGDSIIVTHWMIELRN